MSGHKAKYNTLKRRFALDRLRKTSRLAGPRGRLARKALQKIRQDAWLRWRKVLGHLAGRVRARRGGRAWLARARGRIAARRKSKGRAYYRAPKPYSIVHVPGAGWVYSPDREFHERRPKWKR